MRLESTGTLSLIATPIGNLGDLPPRAREAFEAADAIACEDTRVTGKLIQVCGLEKRELIRYHDRNEAVAAATIADRIAAGANIVLVCDAGTPAISDPGFRLVRECRKRAVPVTAIPGPCAAAVALSLSGLPSDGFLFVGFLPPKSAARRRFFEKYSDFEYTLVIYESCHRIVKFLEDLVESLGGDRAISVSRELTKLHETVHSGPAGTVLDAVRAGSQKGEFVVAIAKRGFAI